MNHTKTYYRVIYGDTDAMKIVYNANYLHFFERGRNEFLRQLGFPYVELVEKNGLQLPLAESHVHYKKPARYDDLLEIRSMVLELKNASVVIGYEIYNKDTGEAAGDRLHKARLCGHEYEACGPEKARSGAQSGYSPLYGVRRHRGGGAGRKPDGRRAGGEYAVCDVRG